MLSSISFSPTDGSLPCEQPHIEPDRRKRTTEAVYALCVLVTGVLLLMTAV